MGWEITWLEIARDDLEGIVRFIAADNPEAGEREGFAIIDRIEKLREMPEMGSVVPERDDPTIRQVVYRHYRIIYRIFDKSHRIEIWRIWHGRREKLKFPAGT